MTKEDFLKSLKINNVSYTDEMIEKAFLVMKETLEANKKFNLTAIKNEEEFLEKMILDSIIPFNDVDFENKSILDFGTGAGFPGLMIKIFYPNAKVTLLDATKKKCDYLSEVSKKLNIDVNVINARGEEASKTYYESFDYVTARAVAELSELMELTCQLIKVNGILISLKGSKGYKELENAKGAMKTLNLKLMKIKEDMLPITKEERVNLFFKKTDHIQKKYPRDYNVIIKKHL